MENQYSAQLNKNELIVFEKLKQKWKELSIEDIILDGLYLNCARLVKEYFDKYLKIDLKQEKIEYIGLKSALQLLADRDLRGAEILLNHMNFDSNQKIYQICFFTPYKQLRDYLISVLLERKKLNQKETDLINSLKKVEMVYPCRSYEKAKNLVKPYEKLNIEDINIKSTKNDFFITKEIVDCTHNDDSDSTELLNRYSHLIIEWLREWSDETINSILIDSLIIKNENIFDCIEDLMIWKIIIEQNNINLIKKWIDYSYEIEKDDSNEESRISSQNIFKAKLTHEMIDIIYDSKYLPKESKIILLNYLAQYNIFCTKESDNFDKHILRLSSSNTLFNKGTFISKDSQFHINLILNLINRKNIPVDFLWSYLNYYNLINTDKSSNALLADSQNIEINSCKTIRMILAFRQNLNQTVNLDPANFFSNISVKNFEFILDQPNTLQISNLFSPKYKDHHLVALAISLYFDIPLSSTESSALEHLIEEYPALRLITDHKLQQPISLYALLQEHSRLEIAKCFMWQKGNTIGLYKLDDSTSKFKSILPSFENNDFATRYAYKDNLDYAYFIKEGRPFFAYHYFIQNQLKKYGKINKTLLEEAKLRTNLILIKNYDDTKISTSCLMFTELIEADTFKQKLNLHLMKILSEYYMKRNMEHNEAIEKTKNLFIDFFRGEIEAKKMVSIFENVLITTMIERFDSKQMFTMEVCALWLPLMCFCKVNNLPYSSKYLQTCAESNQWLMYLLFSQMYQIPRYQVISCLEYFTNVGLKQHLEYALHNVITSSNSMNSDSSNSSLSVKLKNAFKKTENKFSIASSWFRNRSKSLKTIKPNKKSTEKNDSSENEDQDIIEYQNLNQEQNEQQYQDSLESVDFYELLIHCQNSTEPVLQLQLEAIRWYSPVLAVFATFYQQHDKISCLCTFLYSSMKQQKFSSLSHNISSNDLTQIKQRAKTKLKFYEKQPSQSASNGILFGLNHLNDAILLAASKSYLRTLLNSLRIFLPRTILDIYTEFLYCIFVIKDSNQSNKLYSDYKHELIKLTLSKHQSYIPLEWYEDVINKLTRITIIKCNIIDDLVALTNVLGENNEYKRLIKLVYILKSNKMNINCDDLLDIDDKSDIFNEICFKVIEELLKIQNFNQADDLASYCELRKDRIHLARIGKQIETIRLNNDLEEILDFWKNAHIDLMKIGIKDTDFIDFLKFQNSRSNLLLERIVLLNLICQLCPNDQETSKNLFVLLFHFVIDYKKKNEKTNLRDIFKKMLLFGTIKVDPVKDLIVYVIREGTVNDFSDCSNILNDQEKEALNILLYNLVDIGKLTQSYVIAKHFKYFNQDFRILLNMIYICLDMIKPEDLDYDSYSVSFKGIQLTNVLRSLSKPSESSSETVKDRIKYLDKMVNLCHYGNKFSKRIKLDYELANEVLKISFSRLNSENEWNLLKMILSNEYSNKYEIAKQFVRAHDINLNGLIDFILDEVLLVLSSYVQMNKNNNTFNQTKLPNLMFNPTNNEEFSKLIKIFDQNINLFGNKLLEKSRSLLNEAKKQDDFTIVTELLIRSHDCYVQSCSMEGISNILQLSKMCAEKLEKAGEFNLMIRLLTGIAHFSEMTYIMDYLWNNNQFEMLFGKGIGKEDKLKLALLDYLKRYHPDDHETYTMVTLNFTMHREIAAMLEEAAYRQLKILENKKIENTAEILTDLQSILQYFGDAAQSYMKEDCVKKAESCVKKARLTALQINFLSINIIVINLNSQAVTKFIINHPKFWEGFIVSDAYDRKTDWPQAIFNQYILNNNEKYLIDFKSHLNLSGNIIEEVSNRYKLCNEQMTAQSRLNMKSLLKYCKDISQYYKLCSALDFKDSLSELQSKNCASIINDLIYTKKI